MTGHIFKLTLHQLFFRKSTLLLAGLAALPVLVALVFSLQSDAADNVEMWTARSLYNNFVVAFVLPLVALLLGTSALGDEFEDGTAVYLLTKPIPRWQILLPKLGASWAISALIVSVCALLSGFVAGASSSLVIGFTVAMIVGALAYCCVFVLLSVSTSRALIAGLVYVFVWEGAITGIFDGARYLSIRHFTMGLGGFLSDVSPLAYRPTVGGTTALILFAIVIVATTFYAVRQLERHEVREPS